MEIVSDAYLNWIMFREYFSLVSAELAAAKKKTSTQQENMGV
ncbi:UNVERIFIED_ORG: hypothetical protein ABIC97_005845 [Peribacillus simplex]